MNSKGCAFGNEITIQSFENKIKAEFGFFDKNYFEKEINCNEASIDIYISGNSSQKGYIELSDGNYEYENLVELLAQTAE